MAQPFKVVIIGAGLGGLACAIASRKQGLDVIVLEKVEKLTAVGAGIQIPPNASRIWAQYGLLPRLVQCSSISKAMQMKRWQNGELLCSRSLGEDLDERWPWLVAHRADYQRVLVEECERLDVDLRLGMDVQDIDFENTTVRLGDGKVISGDVIIGADGLWSTLRARILGHDSPPQETGDLAYRGTFSLSSLQALKDPGVDALCKESKVTMWLGPDKHAVFYPVRCGKEFNLIMAEPDNLAPGVKTEIGDVEAMQKVFEGWDPVLTKVLTAFSSVLRWKMLHHDELASWTKNNVALLGDACHPFLPYQGQGAAMAVEDGAILATLLSLFHQARSESRPHPSLPDTLKMYEKLQKSRTTSMHLGSVENRYLYHMKDGPRQEERDRILKGVSWKEKPDGEAEPYIWIDYRYQMDVVSRDAIGEAKKRWEEVVGEMTGQPK